MTEASELVARLRKRGLTIDAIARAIGARERTLYRWASGDTEPDGPGLTLLRLMDSEPAVLRALGIEGTLRHEMA